jgi:hypothetical protein
VQSADFGRSPSEATDHLTILTRAGLLMIGRAEAQLERPTRRQPVDNPHVDQLGVCLALLASQRIGHRVYLRDERLAGPAGRAHVEPIAGTLRRVDRLEDRAVVLVGSQKVELPFADLQRASRGEVLPTNERAHLTVYLAGARVIVSDS